mgnify:CR=1 FL=1
MEKIKIKQIRSRIGLLYSVSLGLLGYTEEAQYSAHWPATILLFAIAIRQRRRDFNKKSKGRWWIPQCLLLDLSFSACIYGD